MRLFALQAPYTADVETPPRVSACPYGAGSVSDIARWSYREHSVRYIGTSYGWKAEDVVADTPRDFEFVTNCSDYQQKSSRVQRLLWGHPSQKQYAEALAKLGSSPLGQGRLWITTSKTSHANSSDPFGRIEWIRFTVELKLPSAAPKRE
jgi:hypothetical protein